MGEFLTNAGGVVGLIAIVILTVILWSTFHKYIFRIYFGGLSDMFLAVVFEFIGCAIVASVIVGFAGGILLMLLQGIGSFLSFLLSVLIQLFKIAIVVVVIAGIIYGIKTLINKKKENEGNKAAVINQAEVEETMICPNCGMEYKCGNSFCENCGSKLEKKEELQVVKRCEKCGAPVSEEDKFCLQCGAQICPKETAEIEPVNVCPNCGKQVMYGKHSTREESLGNVLRIQRRWSVHT